MNIKKLHYFSGITLSLFIGVHLFNHLAALFGATLHMRIMDVLRVVYRNPVIETILLIAVFFQAMSGIQLVRKVRKQSTGFYPKLQIYTGLYLAFFLVAHTVATVWQGRQVLKLDTNFYYAAVVVNALPAALFFMPYYFLAVMSVFGHVAAIHFQKTQHLSVNHAQKQAKMILITGAIIGILILVSLNQTYQGIEIPKEYYKTLEGYF
ncbi:hypothetical protein BKI52_12315 [marine bacterium AO1-C]|nr:hypothetical protein BKI52_12315 [marine bacterium AO1-C]